MAMLRTLACLSATLLAATLSAQPAFNQNYGFGCYNTVFLTAMSLNASPTPVSTASSGTTLIFALNEIPLACPAPAPVFHFGVLMLSLGQNVLGTDLLSGYGIDAPGCKLHITSIDTLLSFIATTPGTTANFPVPPGVPPGFQFYTQAAALICPYSLSNGMNGAGLTLSNGVRSYVSNF